MKKAQTESKFYMKNKICFATFSSNLHPFLFSFTDRLEQNIEIFLHNFFIRVLETIENFCSSFLRQKLFINFHWIVWTFRKLKKLSSHFFS